MKTTTVLAIGLFGLAGAALAQVVNPQTRAPNNSAAANNSANTLEPLNNSNAVPTEDRLDNRSATSPPDNGVMRNEADPPLDARSPQAERLSRGGTGTWSGTGAASSGSGSTSPAGTSNPR